MPAQRSRVFVMNPQPMGGAAPVNPTGRLDLLLLAVGERAMRKVERVLGSVGIQAELWDGPEGLQSAITQYCRQSGLTGRNVLSPVYIAQRAGILKRQRERRRAS